MRTVVGQVNPSNIKQKGKQLSIQGSSTEIPSTSDQCDTLGAHSAAITRADGRSDDTGNSEE